MPAFDQSWLLTIVTGAFCASAAAEWLYLRRLRRFGDPALLSLDNRWAPKIVSALLFIVSVGMIGGILFENQSDRFGKTRDVEIAALIDAGAIDPLTAERGTVTDAVRKVAEQFPHSRIAIYRSESELQQISPSTFDLEGALILTDRLVAGEGDTNGMLRDHAREVLSASNGNDRRRVVAVLTRQSPYMIAEVLSDSLSPTPLVVSLEDRAHPQFGIRNRTGRWEWSSAPDAAGRALQSPGTGLRAWARVNRIRMLAGLALLSLSIQTMLFLARGNSRAKFE